MIENKDILNNEELRKNPFTVPQGYFDSMEDKLRAAVNPDGAGEAVHTRWSVLKPAFSLALMFCIIFGMGWGMLRITSTFSPQQLDATATYEYAEELDMWHPIHLEYLSDNASEDYNIEDEQISEEDILEYFSSDKFSQMYMYNYLASLE
ncbi:MAG: hypothetical protein HUJ92_07105 [Bacteroidales bacterium]|nr:hypothetical protein [Bacteroidales bacterium]